MAGERIAGSSLIVRKARATDTSIDNFYFGPEDWAVEVEEEFKSRVWEPDRDLFLYLLDDPENENVLVAGARLGYGNLPDPASPIPTEGERRHYFLVMSFGVQVDFQHKDDPASDPPRRWASIVMDHAEAKARAKERCVGMSLWVRVENAGAQRFYERHGFKVERGPFEDEGQSYLEMRKRFEGR